MEMAKVFGQAQEDKLIQLMVLFLSNSNNLELRMRQLTNILTLDQKIQIYEFIAPIIIAAFQQQRANYQNEIDKYPELEEE